MIAFFSSLFQAETAIKQYRREEQWRQVRTVTVFTIAYGVEFRRSCFTTARTTRCWVPRPSTASSSTAADTDPPHPGESSPG